MNWLKRGGRRRPLITLVVLVLAMAAVAVTARLVDRARTPDPEVSLDCLPFSPPKDIHGLNELLAHYRSVPGFVGADVGADVLLQDGRRLWVFGDTLRQKDFDGQQFVHNSMLMFYPGCATVVMPHDHGAVIPDRADGVGYWPMDMVAIHQQGVDLVAVTLQRMRTTGVGLFDFEVLGPSFAVFEVPAGKAPELRFVDDLGQDDPDLTRPMWGAAVETDGRMVYVYGTRLPKVGASLGHALQVARVHVLTVGDLSTWRYWDGHAWVRKASRAVDLVPAVGGVSQVLSVFHRGHTWYALSKRDDVYGRDLVIWKAPSPRGPFVASAPLAELPSNSADGLIRYMPLAHPDLLPAADSVVVSYSRNAADLERLRDHPSLYRPRFLRVPLP